MAFTSPLTAVSGATFTAAQFNTNVRDNLNAIWVGTTAGDVDYYTSSSAKTRLAIGGAGTFLKSSGSAPTWGSLDFANVYHDTAQNVSNASATALVFNTDGSDVPGWHSTSVNTSRITVSANGQYMLSAWFIYITGGGSGYYSDYVNILRSGSSIGSFRALQEKDANGKHFLVTVPIIGATAGQYFEVTLEQNSGETAVVAANARFSALRVG